MSTADLFGPDVVSSARFSDCGRYRYTLQRTWGEGPVANFLMLNPSKANEVDNDPTVERQIRRVKGWNLGYGGIIVTNIFALVSTDPKALYETADPVGPENDDAIVEAAYQSSIIICAWGNHGRLNGRGDYVRRRLRSFAPLYYLRLSESTGQPWHPLYLPYDLTPQVWAVTR